MVFSEGELKYCPFRTYLTDEPYVIDGQNTIASEWFMPCEKEKCICYQKKEYDDSIAEWCYREQIAFQTTSRKENENE